MTLQSFLDYSLLKIGTIHITVYKLLLVFIVFISTVLILRAIKKAFIRFHDKSRYDLGSIMSFYQITRYLTWTGTIAIMLNILGFNLTILLASSAALLVGFGLGVQQIFNDYVSGVLILLEQNIKVGNILEIENERIGKIMKIGIRTSKILTRDDITVVVPNSKLINESTINWSNIDGKIRFKVNIGVAYGSDTQLVKQVLLQCAKQTQDVCNTPAPFIRFIDFGQSSLDFQVIFWTAKPFIVENIKSNLRFNIDQQFRKNNIQIPFPQHHVHIISK